MLFIHDYLSVDDHNCCIAILILICDSTKGTLAEKSLGQSKSSQRFLPDFEESLLKDCFLRENVFGILGADFPPSICHIGDLPLLGGPVPSFETCVDVKERCELSFRKSLLP